MWLCIIMLLVVSAVCQEDEDSELIVLNDDNFEHLTQVSSGATTGDWLIMMTKDEDKCSDCSKVEKQLKKVAAEFKGRTNVAKIDPENSDLTIRRFRIPKKVTVMFFRHGLQWVYKGEMKKKKISQFISGGYEQQQAFRANPPLDSLDIWKEDFVREMKAAIKERRFPERNALLALLAILLVAMGVAAYFVCRDDDEDKKKRKKRR